MVQSCRWNGNTDSKLNQDDLCSLQDYELDRVSGGFTPRDPNDVRDYSKNVIQLPDGVPSGRRF